MFQGSGVAIVTPFKAGKVDEGSFLKLIDFQLENNTQALIVLGTTGESPTQTNEERSLLIKLAVERVAGRIPVIVGTGTNYTEKSVEYTKEAEALGADGILAVTPYYNKGTQKGLIAHFKAIAESTSLPVILYNVPARTSINMSPQVVYELSKVKNIIGVKEASGDLAQIMEIRRLTGPEFKIYSGDDDLIAPTYASGGNGIISVAANVIPAQIQEVCSFFESGQVQKSIDLQIALKYFIDQLFIEVNPIPVKAALATMGKIENELRLPLTPIEEDHLDILKGAMRELELI